MQQATKQQLLVMPNLTRCLVRLTHWRNRILPEEEYDGEALLEIQRTDDGSAVEYLTLADRPWVVYGLGDIEDDGNVYLWLGGDQMVQMQVFCPNGLGQVYSPTFGFHETQSYLQALQHRIVQDRTYQHSAPVIVTHGPTVRLPTGVKVVNTTASPLFLTRDGIKVTRVDPCGYALYARKRLLPFGTRGKASPTHFFCRQYGAPKSGWEWIDAMKRQYGSSLVFLGTPLCSKAYVRHGDAPVVSLFPYIPAPGSQVSPGQQPLVHMDAFEVPTFSGDEFYFTF